MTTTKTIGDEAMELRDAVITTRRHLHMNPELSFEEYETAKYAANRMRALGLEVTEGLGGTGVVGVLNGARPGKTIVFRAEADAVDMLENTEAEYASRFDGRNHCCGHDLGMAVALGSAELLARHRDEIAGRVAFVFQPADEPMTGALPMIRDGLFDIVKPDFALGMHVNAFLDVGQVVVQDGPLWASRDELKVRITRQPVRPGTQQRPLPLAVAELVTKLHAKADDTVSGRELASFLVASVQAQQGRFNQPGLAELAVNFGSHDVSLREDLHAGVRGLLDSWASEEGTTYEIEAEFAIPPLHNEANVTAVVKSVAREAVGEENIVTGWRNSFADDFAFYSTAGAGCYILIGTRNEAKGITAAWHTPEYDMDEDALPLGVQIISGTALELLKA